jgi:hypothetical protein
MQIKFVNVGTMMEISLSEAEVTDEALEELKELVSRELIAYVVAKEVERGGSAPREVIVKIVLRQGPNGKMFLVAHVYEKGGLHAFSVEHPLRPDQYEMRQ